jgi:hypothetical protein
MKVLTWKRQCAAQECGLNIRRGIAGMGFAGCGSGFSIRVGWVDLQTYKS